MSHCRQCGETLIAPKRLYCNERCRGRWNYSRRGPQQREKDRFNGNLSQQRTYRKERAELGLTVRSRKDGQIGKNCIGCGAKFETKNPARIYCSTPCKAVTLAGRLCLACACPIGPDLSARKYCSKECRHKGKLAWDRNRHEAARQKAAAVPVFSGECVECLRPFDALYGEKRWRYCSEKCSRRASNRRSGKIGASDSRRRARKFGVAYEWINRHQVFGRDGYRCQICGCKTPARFQGSTKDNAPELDHRIPLALGGGHLYANVQTACRKCNRRKGGHTIVGQLNLFPHDKHASLAKSAI